MANGIIMSLMVKEFISRREIAYIKVNFHKGSTMAKEKWSIRMEISMKAHIKMVKKMGKVFIHGQMVIIMTGNGKMIVHKEEAHP